MPLITMAEISCLFLHYRSLYHSVVRNSIVVVVVVEVD